MKQLDFPVYLFTGFLESGKTKFIQETLEDKRFCNGEKTLLLVCEEGIEEYDPSAFADSSVFIRIINDREELTQEFLKKLAEETKAERAVIEYNGMWMIDDLYAAMPEDWMVYQEFTFADATTFLNYNANMRQLVYDKLKSCELVVFNRFTDDMDKMEFHKIVRGASRRTDICYESPNGDIKYDDIVDPLPFDINASVIDIGDDDYAVWYRDMSEEPDKYDGKTVRFKARALSRKKIPEGCIVVGRHVMTCCAEDIQFAALICENAPTDKVKDDSWITLKGKVCFKFHQAYNKKGPVIEYMDFSEAEAPEQDVTTFY